MSVQLLWLIPQAFLSAHISQSKIVHRDSPAQVKWDGQQKKKLQFLLVLAFYTLIKILITLLFCKEKTEFF